MQRRRWSILVVALTLLVLAACSRPEATSDSTSITPDSNAQEQLRFSIATSGTAGVWYPVATAIAENMSNRVPYVRATAEPSSASVENVRNLREGRIGMAVLASSTAYWAGTGTGDFENMPLRELRSLFHPFKVMSSQFLIVRDDSGIEKIEDLRGKRVGVGATGSSNETTARDILAYHGLTYDDIRPQLVSAVEMVTALQDGVLDAAFLQQIPGAPVLTELLSSTNVRFISWDTSDFLRENPFYIKVVTPPGAFPGIDHEIESIGISGVFYTTTKYTEDQVYDMVKATWDHIDAWEDVHAQVRGVEVEDAITGMVLPLHAGALKYFLEKGLNFPDDLIPPEAR